MSEGKSVFGLAPFTLTPFQDEDVKWLRSGHDKALIAYDRGLGKTVIATKRNIIAGVGTHLVACPANAINTWISHTREWYQHFYPGDDLDIFFVTGKPEMRKRMWDELLRPERTHHHRLFVVTYGTALRDLNYLTPKHWAHVDQIDLDEAHKMRHRTSQNFKLWSKVLHKHPYFTFLTGTPVSRGQQEFWTYLNCCNPKYFSSYWRYVGAFCELIDGRFGKEIIGPRNTENFYNLLREYCRIRLKTDEGIAEQMPSKTRVSIYCELDEHQQRIYQDLEADKFIWTQGGKIVVAATAMEEVMRLRQLLVCPKILDETLSLGGAFNDFLDTMDDADDTDCHTVVFTPFKSAFGHFRKALEARGHHVSQLSGGISSTEQLQQISEWRRHRGIMLCTCLYAESFDLEPAKSSWNIGYEWDPNVNSQAEDRLHRLTTTWPVTNNYYRYKNTIDDQVCFVVNWKSEHIHQIMQGAR